MDVLRDVVVLNGGHFPAEVAVGAICADERVTSVAPTSLTGSPPSGCTTAGGSLC
jgi:hypothetical protein